MPIFIRLSELKITRCQRHQLAWLVLLLLTITTANANATAYRDRPYYTAKNQFWRILYSQGGQTLYCKQAFTAKARGRRVNLEHIFPMSWVTKHLKCGNREQCAAEHGHYQIIAADLHNIYPALIHINKARSAMAYGKESKNSRAVTANCALKLDYKTRRATPEQSVRGNVARAMLYMAERYQLPLYSRQKKLMYQWHHQDPADDHEKQRNRIIFRLQGNFNRFIDPNLPLVD